MVTINISEAAAFPEGGTAVALGNFDGVHIGHSALLEKTAACAKERGLVSAVFTFVTHPAFSLSEKPLELITDTDEKLELFASHGIERVYFADFDALRHYSPESFVSKVLKAQLHAKLAVCGYNFRFGENGVGSSETLTALMDGNVEVIPPILINGQPVSSSLIRKAVELGDMECANAMLGRPYSLTCTVVHGKELGRTIGTPTINQNIPPHSVIPSFGVYACLVLIDGKTYEGVANIGNRPTVDSNGKVNCETYIIGFNGDLYEKKVKVCFKKKLRGEIRFASLSELKAQISRDIEMTEAYFQKKNGEKA